MTYFSWQYTFCSELQKGGKTWDKENLFQLVNEEITFQMTMVVKNELKIFRSWMKKRKCLVGQWNSDRSHVENLILFQDLPKT
jgi:hypothetical protein